jgi:hypothetical protein
VHLASEPAMSGSRNDDLATRFAHDSVGRNFDNFELVTTNNIRAGEHHTPSAPTRTNQRRRRRRSGEGDLENKCWPR